VLTDADFDEANVEATHRVDILDFVDFSAIDPRFVERPYYIAPSKAGAKAYAVLRETLKRTGKAGVGKVVIRTRQHLAAVVAGEDALELIILRFADELRSAADLDLPEQNLKKLGVSSKELEMAEQLVSGMVAPFKPEQYEDEYKRDVMKLIRKKEKAGEVNRVREETEKKPRRPAGAKVIDLASLLASSLKEGRSSPPSRSPRKKSAPAAQPRKTARSNHHRKSA
jgi:DNA end-binding protein Ku